MLTAEKKIDTVFRFSGILTSVIRNRVHVATCSIVAAWTWSQLAGGSPILKSDALVIPLTMLCIYQWNRLFDTKEDSINSPGSVNHTIRNTGWIAGFCVICVSVCVILSIITGSLKGVLILLWSLILGILYSAPFFSVSGKRLKNLPIVKNLTSALGWTLLTVFYAPIHSDLNLTVEHLFAAIMMFSAVWSVELIWDIRDLKGDAQSGVKTIPVLLGIGTARKWIWAINGISAFILAGGVMLGMLSNLWVLLLLNHGMVHIWVSEHYKVLFYKDSSHLLVGLQTVLLISLGLFAVFLT